VARKAEGGGAGVRGLRLEKWDSPNQRLIGAFGTVPIFPCQPAEDMAIY